MCHIVFTSVVSYAKKYQQLLGSVKDLWKFYSWCEKQLYPKPNQQSLQGRTCTNECKIVALDFVVLLSSLCSQHGALSELSDFVGRGKHTWLWCAGDLQWCLQSLFMAQLSLCSWHRWLLRLCPQSLLCVASGDWQLSEVCFKSVKL